MHQGWVVALAAFAFLSACGKPANIGRPEPLRIGFLADPLASLLYIAQEKGMFQRRGLEVTFRDYEGGMYAVQDLRRGEIEVAVCTEYALMLQNFAKGDLRAIGTIATANNSEVIARTDRGIRQVEDLRGKKVGVSKGMNTEYLLGSFLAFYGLRLRDVQIENLRPSALAAALTSGSIDAACLYPPYSYAAKADLGGQVVAWSAQGGQDYFFLLTTTTEILRRRPAALKALLAAALEAEEYLKRHGAEAREVLARRLDLAPERLAEQMAQIRFEVGLHQELLTMMEDEAHWAAANGAIASGTVPNLFQSLSLEPLEQLKPEAVGVIH